VLIGVGTVAGSWLCLCEIMTMTNDHDLDENM
jgi:hypothetical protein